MNFYCCDFRPYHTIRKRAAREALWAEFQRCGTREALFRVRPVPSLFKACYSFSTPLFQYFCISSALGVSKGLTTRKPRNCASV